MSATLQELAIRPIRIPVWNNDRLHADKHGHLWIRDNLQALRDYYDSIRPYCEGEPLVDFWSFCKGKYKDTLACAFTADLLPHGGSL